MHPKVKKIAIYLYWNNFSGVVQVYRNLAVGFLEAGYEVEFLVRSVMPELLHRLPPQVKITTLKSTSSPYLDVLLSPFFLARQLSRARHDVLIAGELIGSEVAAMASLLNFRRTPLLLVDHDSSAQRFAPRYYPWSLRIYLALFTKIRRMAQAFVAVSQGVKRDMAFLTGISPARIECIYNPLDIADITAKSEQPPPHPWLMQTDIPVILTASRLYPNKDVITLVRAFAEARKTRPCKLIIGGEGKSYVAEIKDCIRQLGVGEDVDMPGFLSNPYSYMAHASVYVLPSQSEAFGLVLAEAMACGCQVVSTDMQSGPAEILEDGKYGTLVPIGDHRAMSRAINEVLDGKKVPAELLKARAGDFAMEKITAQYLHLVKKLI